MSQKRWKKEEKKDSTDQATLEKMLHDKMMMRYSLMMWKQSVLFS